MLAPLVRSLSISLTLPRNCADCFSTEKLTGASCAAAQASGRPSRATRFEGFGLLMCHDTHCAHQCVEHDNVNVLAMGHWIIGQNLAEEIVTAFIGAEFEDNEDFHRRVAKLDELEEWGRTRA